VIPLCSCLARERKGLFNSFAGEQTGFMLFLPVDHENEEEKFFLVLGGGLLVP